MKASNQKDPRARVLNLVRGALSMMRVASTPEVQRDRWHQEQLANQQIHRALSVARSKLNAPQVREIETWVVRQLRDQNRALGRLGTSIASLGLFPEQFLAQPLWAELELVRDKIQQGGTRLLDFCDDVLLIQQAFIASDWIAISGILRLVGARHGYSYWGIELALAVAQATGGMEKVKTEVAAFSPGTTGAQKFLLHYFGVRNETAQTIPRYRSTLSRKIDETELHNGLKTYFKYRLYRSLTLSEGELAQVLSAEQMTTDIDLLFTSFSIVRWINTNPRAFSRRIQLACISLTTVLEPFATRLGIDIAFEGGRPAAADTTESKSTAMELYLDSPTDLTFLANSAIDRLWSQPSGEDKRKGQLDRVVDGVVSRLSTRSDGVEAEDLAKLQANFATLPLFIQLGNADEVPPFVSLFLETMEGESSSRSPSNIKEALTYVLSNVISNESTSTALLANCVRVLSLVANANRANHEDQALELLQAGQGEASPLELDSLLVVASTIQQKTDRTAEAIRTAALAGVKNPRLIPLLPLPAIFHGARWNTLAQVGASVELSVCLDLYLKSSGDTKARSHKRFSVEDLLVHYKCEDLLKLQSQLQNSNLDVGLIQYFFGTVCDIYTLELLPDVGNSRKAQELRIQILRNLTRIPGVKPGDYVDEANNLESTLGITDGLEMLDDSRVYVDESRVISTVNRELSADFQRYLNLVAIGIGVNESFADILKAIKQPSAKHFQIPSNDADDLFGEITARIREKFLNDSTSGLDIHIGRRIRHGTIASHFRGPLEALMLIGQRPRPGANYEPPEAAISACIHHDQKTRTRVYAAFSRFAEAIDQLITLLRDEYFHVQSKSKPRGMFDVPFTPIYLALARGLAQSCSSIEEYSKHCIELFWIQLATHMAKTRPTAEAESKRTINSAFEKLMQELRAAGIKDSTLFASIQQALEELRRRVPIMGSWMRVPKASVEGKVFSMQRIVDVAVALVRGQRPAFRPIVVPDVPKDLALDTYGMSVVVDALYIGLDNVFMHSGKKSDNEVHIEIEFDETPSLLKFRILSELGRDGRTPEKEAKIAAIRANIAKRVHKESARLDHNSGLSKLATLVLQSEETSITFDFVGSTHFELLFSLHFVGRPIVTTNDSVEDLINSLGIDGMELA